MGTIQKQSINQSLVNYIGVGVGALSVMFLYPTDKEAYGIARFLLGTGLLLAPMINLGFSAVTIRFFEEFGDNRDNKKGFLGFLLLSNLIGAAIFLLLAFLFKEQIFEFYEEKSPLFQKFLPYLLPLAIFFSVFQILTSYSTNYHKIVVPSMIQNMVKITLPFLFILLAYNVIGYEGMAKGLVAHWALAVLATFFYLYYLGALNWKLDFAFLTSERLGRIRSFATYGLLANYGSLLATRIDEFMIPTLIDFTSNGVYAIAAFIGTAIMIPGTAVMQISSPIIASAIKNGDWDNVGKIYSKASTNLTLVGLFFFVAIICSVEDLFSMMSKPEELVGGFSVVLFICLAKLIDLMTSVNNQIINYSKYYRFGMWAIIVLGVMNVFLNLYLIPKYGITGAAMATFSSLVLYNILKLLFIYLKFNIQPFTRQTIILLLIALVSFIVGYWIPITETAWIDILIRSTAISLFYIPSVLYLNISPDINLLLKQRWEKIKG